jgi:uncharacterized protein (TIGR03000 family)
MRSLLLFAMVGVAALGLPLAGPSAAFAGEAPARLRVLLPADATLTIDGQPTRSTTADRLFVTPPLAADKVFHYDITARFSRGDESVTIERRVAVRAGEETTVRLGLPETAAVAFEGDQPDTANRSLYYSPDQDSRPATTRSSYYAPATNFAPDFSPPYIIGGRPSGGVASARENWKPDFSDPFLLSNSW